MKAAPDDEGGRRPPGTPKKKAGVSPRGPNAVAVLNFLRRIFRRNAKVVSLDTTVFVLDGDEFDRFMDLMENPPPPTPAIIEAAKMLRRLRSEKPT